MSVVIEKLTYILELLFVFKSSPVSEFLLTVRKLDVGVVYHVLGALSPCHGEGLNTLFVDAPHLVQKDMRNMRLLVV